MIGDTRPLGSAAKCRSSAISPPAVERADAYFASLALASEDIVQVLDLEARLLLINPHGQELLGIKDWEAVRGTYWPHSWPAESRVAIESALAEAHAGRLGRFQERRAIATGEKRLWRTVVSPVTRADGAPTQFLAISRDVTQDGRERGLADAAVAQSESAQRSRSAFFSNVSHELRTPLNSIIGMASLLEQTALDHDQRAMLEVVREAGDGLARKLGDILDHTRLDAGRLEIFCAPFHLGEIIRDTVAAASMLAENKGLAFSVDITPSAETTVLGDALRLKKIIGHLLSNAVKFTDKGSVMLSAERDSSGKSRITVTDTGMGIPPSVQADIFHEGDGSHTRRHGGLGLGLALSRQLATLLEAELDCQSAPDKGTVFTLTIPLPTPSPHGNVEPSGAIRVLVADDHAANREVLKRVLAQVGAEVFTAEDGAQACSQFVSSKFDLIIMDMQMPVMDGLSAIREMRTREVVEKRRRTPIVVFTANATEESKAASKDVDADAFLTKPLSSDALITALRNILAGGPAGAGDQVHS